MVRRKNAQHTYGASKGKTQYFVTVDSRMFKKTMTQKQLNMKLYYIFYKIFFLKIAKIH